MTTLDWECNVCGTSASGPFDETLLIVKQHTHEAQEKHA